LFSSLYCSCSPLVLPLYCQCRYLCSGKMWGIIGKFKICVILLSSAGSLPHKVSSHTSPLLHTSILLYTSPHIYSPPNTQHTHTNTLHPLITQHIKQTHHTTHHTPCTTHPRITHPRITHPRITHPRITQTHHASRTIIPHSKHPPQTNLYSQWGRMGIVGTWRNLW
jgi:hypothetical protein